MVDEVSCPYCGEPGSVDFDAGELEPGEHRFVQDCAVCCRPWDVVVRVRADGTLALEVERS